MPASSEGPTVRLRRLGMELRVLREAAGRRVGVRDSKNRSEPPLVFTVREWACFLTGARSGEFDLPA